MWSHRHRRILYVFLKVKIWRSKAENYENGGFPCQFDMSFPLHQIKQNKEWVLYCTCSSSLTCRFTGFCLGHSLHQRVRNALINIGIIYNTGKLYEWASIIPYTHYTAPHLVSVVLCSECCWSWITPHTQFWCLKWKNMTTYKSNMIVSLEWKWFYICKPSWSTHRQLIKWMMSWLL